MSETSESTSTPTSAERRSNKESKAMNTKSKVSGENRYWQRVADRDARENYLHNFPTRHGTIEYVDRRGAVEAVCYYSNNPDPHRENGIEWFRAKMRDAGVRELAFGSFPKHGADAGYTIALIVEATSEKQVSQIGKCAEKIIFGKFLEVKAS